MKPLKFVVTGPESCGKTTLAQDLGKELEWTVVPEYARSYLEGISGGAYDRNDFDKIVKGQIDAECQVELNAQQPLIYDTSVVVLHIWHLEKWGGVHPLVQDRLTELENTFFLLCRPDIPWVYDPLREHSSQRERLYSLYKKVLTHWKFSYKEIGGNRQGRLESAILQIKKWVDGIE